MVKMGTCIPGDVVKTKEGNYYSATYGVISEEKMRALNNRHFRSQQRILRQEISLLERLRSILSNMVR